MLLNNILYYIVLGDDVYKPSGLLSDPYARSYLYVVNVY